MRTGGTVPDYGHDLVFGGFLTPGTGQPDLPVALARECERAGLDLVTFQDHPYQPTFADTWTLLSYVAAATTTVKLSANVLNLPLRSPAVVARAAASLDRLTGGRVELGLGAGAFWEAIEAMGGRRLSPAQAVRALSEAIAVIRGIWRADERGALRVDGEFYQVHGAKRGPAPAHDIAIWLGAYKPRMLELTGREADGWLPSLGYLEPGELGPGNARIDEAAAAAGRDPAAIRRMLNINGSFGRGAGFLAGPPGQWAEQLAELTLRDGVSAFILGSDDPVAIRRFGEEVAPATRELVAAGRAVPPTGEGGPAATAGQSADTGQERLATELAPPAAPSPASPTPAAERGQPPEWQERLGLAPTPDDGERLSQVRLWDEASRPAAPPPPPGFAYTRQGRAIGAHLVEVHDHLRTELAQIRDLIEQVQAGAVGPAGARSAISEMTMRQNDWTLGAYCASYCRIVTGHHGLEDEAVFPHLRAREPGLAPVVDRLVDEHKVIHKVLDGLDRALVDLLRNPGDFSGLRAAAALLTDTLLSHLAYEEAELIEPLARHGFYQGQL
jgi:alkanesulfonate monooxygenase SsuD/methylene tetrahydromethanopterin reductase-like flavin-dependent oxidoreductase (luciferase family)